MDLTILVCVKNEFKEENIFSLVDYAKKNNFDIIFMSERKHALTTFLQDNFKDIGGQDINSAGVFHALYPSGTSIEAMIEDCIRKINTAVVLIRENFEFSLRFLDGVVYAGEKGADIVMPRAKTKENKLKRWFKEKIQNLSSSLLNFNFYEGDISLQFFSLNAVEIMKETTITYLSKLNRWIGMKIEYVDFEYQPQKLKNIDFGNLFVLLFAYIGIFSALVVGACLLEIFFNLPFLAWLGFSLAFIIDLGLMFLTALRIYTIKKIGILQHDEEKAIGITKFRLSNEK